MQVIKYAILMGMISVFSTAYAAENVYEHYDSIVDPKKKAAYFKSVEDKEIIVYELTREQLVELFKHSDNEVQSVILEIMSSSHMYKDLFLSLESNNQKILLQQMPEKSFCLFLIT